MNFNQLMKKDRVAAGAWDTSRWSGMGVVSFFYDVNKNDALKARVEEEDGDYIFFYDWTGTEWVKEYHYT